MSMPERRALAADFSQYLGQFAAGGSSVLNGSATCADMTLLNIQSFSTSFATAACILTITGAGRTLFRRGFFNGESLADGVLSTPFFDVSVRSALINSVTGNNSAATWVLEGTMRLPRAYSTSESRVLRDRENRIAVGIA
ncbi:TPA: hypothetical protein L9G56_005507, partial [Klebsiella quasipneumoniae]|nr:hypothetical protein [Klebsiella quasipneumoniae]